MSDKIAVTGLALMRVPFLPNQISKLPKPTKKQTDDVKADFKKGVRCQICGTWHHPDVIHLDYVGHAALTDRLLDVDPNWSWEPMAVDAMGYPVIDKDGGMWIKLTVCGVTRLGYGDAQGKSGGDAMKERIGDALRNAAMRFGAALDLWHKGDLHVDEEEPKTRYEKGKETAKTAAAVEEPTTSRIELSQTLATLYNGNVDEMADALRHYSAFTGKDDVEKFLTMANLEHPTANEKMHKWFGSALNKLRKDSESVDRKFEEIKNASIDKLKKDMQP